VRLGHALAAAILAAGMLAGCSGDGSSDAQVLASKTPAAATGDDLAAHTPSDLRHPCEAVPARSVGRVLDQQVTARKVTSELAARTLTCRYEPDGPDRNPRFLEIQSTPDPTSLDSLVRLYVGVDRLQHHPVEVAGADDAEIILQPEDDLVTVFTKQGFVTHAVVLGLADLERGERVAVRLARRVVAANQ
jgi:hypothetical protein